jgi:hypothetical protein
MTLVEDSNGQSLASQRGRPIIFTPERFDQIRNLVERGHSREEIAEIIGCTLGSLQVMCSREGISLRRQRDPAIKAVKRTPPPIVPDPPKPSDLTRDPDDVLSPPGGWPPGHPFHSDPKGKPPATIVLRVERNGKFREITVPVPIEMMTMLVFAAEERGVRVADLIVEALEDACKRKRES